MQSFMAIAVTFAITLQRNKQSYKQTLLQTWQPETTLIYHVGGMLTL